MGLRLFHRLLPARVLAADLCTGSAQAQIVLSQACDGGGHRDATFSNDWIERFKRGSGRTSLTRLSVQYASATGTGNFGTGSRQIVVLPATNLEP